MKKKKAKSKSKIRDLGLAKRISVPNDVPALARLTRRGGRGCSLNSPELSLKNWNGGACQKWEGKQFLDDSSVFPVGGKGKRLFGDFKIRANLN